MSAAPSNTRIPLVSTAFVIYNHANLASARAFLLDFGLTIAHETAGQEIFFKGYGTEPFIYLARQSATSKSSFGGAAYTVPTHSALLAAASNIPGCSSPAPLSAPGGGTFVTATDPCGHFVYLVHGQTPLTPTPPPHSTEPTNYDDAKPRKGTFQRFSRGPAPVHRWGHYGVTYSPGMYAAMYTWYTSHLTLAPSDIVYKGDEPVTVFFHIDRGTEYTDHHAFFFKAAKQGEDVGVAHAAFETRDFDTQMLGHDWLVGRGWEGCWGVGRHVLGSQVFDYWFDASRFIVEHYSDGDLVNSETKVSHVQAGPQALKIWGPPVPAVF